MVNKAKVAIMNLVNKAILVAVVLGFIASAVYGVSNLVEGNEFVKYGLGFLVIGFAVEYIYRNLIKKNK